MEMLNNKNDTVQGAPAPAPIIEPTKFTTSSNNNISPDEEIMNWINSPMPDTDASFGSYLDDSPLFETPLFMDRDSFDADDTPFMPTPLMDTEPLYAFTDPEIFGSPNLLDNNTFADVTGVGIASLPLMGPPTNVQFGGGKDMDLGDFWHLGAEDSPAMAPAELSVSPPVPAPVVNVIANHSITNTAKDKKWTGTRPNVTRESLIPIDAPVQQRSYITPSSTSRKDVPAAFVHRTVSARKRAVSEVAGHDEDEADLQRQIEAKRLQNTLAARRSRARKLDYQKGLEEENQFLRGEIDQLRARVAELERGRG